MNCTRLSLPSGLAFLASLAVTHAADVNLPNSIALPAGSSTTRGFLVRMVQAPTESTVANNSIRAYQQINGTLTDAEGTPIPDVSFSGPEDGAYAADTINFEKDGVESIINDLEGNEIAYFFNQFFPGVPGLEGTTDKFAVEVVAFLELPAGATTFGVSTTSERTDANDDDGYQVFFATNPRDFFGLKAAEYERIAPGFQANWRNENQFTVVAPAAGLYPVRLLYWQTGLGSSLTFYTVNSSSGERVLVNDPAASNAIKAYRDTSVAGAQGPYVGEARPSSGSEGNSAAAPIEAVLFDGATTVETTGVKLFLNDAAVAPQTLTKAEGRIDVAFAPDPTRTNPNNAVRLEFTDSAGVTRTNTWSFGIVAAGGSTTQVTGQWDFENGDLSATVGTPLEYFDGPTGLTQQGTRFGTTTELGIEDIDGVPAKVMEVPGDVVREIGYVMTHGIAPNGGGNRVNQYTLIMDVFVAESGPGAAALLQSSSTSNTDDGDLFWQGNNFGQGNNGYLGRGTFTAGEWHRIVAAYDQAATPPLTAKFVDGIKQDDWTASQGLDEPRRTLAPTAILFADGDQDERRQMWVNSIQIRNGRISDAEAFALGGPSAAGIPQNLPQSTVTGQWDFEFGDLGASIGSNLRYFDPEFDGPTGATDDPTAFGITTDLGLPDIDGQPANVMRVPGTLTRQIGYVMEHRISPNGGGNRVNQYTLIMDVFVAESGAGAAALLQTSSLNNTDDGDLFWQGNNFGQGANGYLGRGTFTAGAWHRIVAAYDQAATPPLTAKFVDGIKQDDWTASQGLDEPRRTMDSTAILFADGDQDERREMWVSSIQIRRGRLSDAQCVLLGGPTASGIPVVLPESNVTGQWDFEYGDLGASVGSNLQYFDPEFDGPAGSTDDPTAFGTTTDLGLPDIGGAPANVMRVPGTLTRQVGYLMEHRISPNGGGNRVNQYTLIMDVLVAESGSGAAALLQTSSLSNTDDGDLFWQGDNFGQGAGGYGGVGTFTAGAWHRVAAAYNMAAPTPVVVKYVDGIFQDNWTADQGLDAPRRTLAPTAILFADGDQDERREMWVSSIQIRSAPLSPAELEALGEPTATGIPLLLTAAAPPSLSVSTDASGNVVITYTGTLQAAGTLGGTFAEVPGATSPYTVPQGSLTDRQFFRSAE